MNKSPQAFPWEFIRNVSDTLGVLAAGEAGQVSRNAGKEAKGMPPVRALSRLCRGNIYLNLD